MALTEMKNDELLRFVSLDVNSALGAELKQLRRTGRT